MPEFTELEPHCKLKNTELLDNKYWYAARYFMLSKREIMAGVGDLANYAWLVTS